MSVSVYGLPFFIFFAVSLAPITARPVSAQKRVTVRFLDPKEGKPIQKMWVSVTQYKGNLPTGAIPASYVLNVVNRQTDKNGAVIITLNDPPPEFIGIQSFDLQNSGPLIPCSVVMKRGVVLTYLREGVKSYFKATDNPGEIVFVERRLSLWDRIRQEIP